LQIYFKDVSNLLQFTEYIVTTLIVMRMKQVRKVFVTTKTNLCRKFK